MRVIAGAAGGRPLTAPSGRGTRPTSDRAREGLFSTLESLRGPLDGALVIDLYAGSGAVGLEALSRGAAQATLVERDRAALAVIARNVAAVGLPGAIVRAEDVTRVLGSPRDVAYDVAFVDPPYSDPVSDVLTMLVAWLAPDAVVVVERSARDAALDWPSGLDPVRERRYGEAVLWYGRRAVEGGPR